MDQGRNGTADIPPVTGRNAMPSVLYRQVFADLLLVQAAARTGQHHLAALHHHPVVGKVAGEVEILLDQQIAMVPLSRR